MKSRLEPALRTLTGWGLAAAAAATFLAVATARPAVVSAQQQAAASAAPAEKPYVPPRTPDGQPDISGMYEPGWIGQPAEVSASGKRWTPPKVAGSAGIGPTDFGAREAAEKSTEGFKRTTTPMVIDPPDGKLPLRPEAVKLRAEIVANQDKVKFLDPRVRCLQAGIPRANMPVYYNSYQIIQKPGHVVIVYEWNHMTRIIPLDGRPHLDPRIRLANGDSRGRWEGNTLVVDVTNFTEDTWVLGHGGVGDGQPADTVTSGHGVPNSSELHVVERYTPVSADVIKYEARIEDPKVFTRPITIAFDVMFRGQPDHQLFEYACHEGNREGILIATGVDIDPDQAAK